MTEYILTVFIILVVLYALLKGCNFNINISVKQEFSQEDRKLLEDLFNEKGDIKDKEHDVQNSFDELIKNVNNIMLGVEDDTNG